MRAFPQIFGGLLLLFAACATPEHRLDSASVDGRSQLIHTAQAYLLRDRPQMRVTERPPVVSYHSTSVDGRPHWRVDFETVVPAPKGYRIPPGTPTITPQSVYLDTNGVPFKRS